MRKFFIFVFSVFLFMSASSAVEADFSQEEGLVLEIFHELLEAVGGDSEKVNITILDISLPGAGFWGNCLEEKTGEFKNGSVTISSGMIGINAKAKMEFPYVTWFTLAHELAHWKLIPVGATCDDLSDILENPEKSRAFELEADREAVRILKKAGLDGKKVAEKALLVFCEEIGKCLEKENSTHPSFTARLANILSVD